jgi:hypothetical protein
MIERLTSSDVTPCLHQSFTLQPRGEAFAAELVAVNELRMLRGGRRGGGEAPPPHAFSMVFAAPAGTAHPQQTFTVSNETLGALPLFLVPIGPLDDGRMGYEAVLG